MKIVIDIPKEVYKSIQDNDYCGISNADMYNAIKNGKALPKGHGRLIDANKAKEDLANTTISRTGNQFERYLDKQQTLIKADKAESEEEEDA